MSFCSQERYQNLSQLFKPPLSPKMPTVSAGDSSDRQPTYPISSVDNALRLVKMLRSHKSIRVAQAGREIGVAPSTAHRLLQMLQYHGFVQQDPSSKAYVAGPALIDLGLAAIRGRDVRS